MEKNEVRDALLQIECARRRLLRPYFTELGLTLGQGQPRILGRLLEGDGVTQRELAQACGLDAATLSRALDRMEETGLIARASHPHSRKAFLVRLTSAGREKARAVKRGFDAVDGLIWSGFSQAQMEVLLSKLRRIKENLEGCGELELPTV